MTFFNGFQPENIIKIIIRNIGFQPLIAVSQNNITKANYYYPLKRVRQMYLDQLPEAEKPAFVELPRLKAERTATVPEVPVMCIKNGNGLSADIFSSVAPLSGRVI